MTWLVPNASLPTCCRESSIWSSSICEIGYGNTAHWNTQGKHITCDIIITWSTNWPLWNCPGLQYLNWKTLKSRTSQQQNYWSYLGQPRESKAKPCCNVDRPPGFGRKEPKKGHKQFHTLALFPVKEWVGQQSQSNRCWCGHLLLSSQPQQHMALSVSLLNFPPFRPKEEEECASLLNNKNVPVICRVQVLLGTRKLWNVRHANWL
jgi:hypothetical protein